MALAGCASNAASRQEVESLKADVQTLHDEQRHQQLELAHLRTELQAKREAPAPAPAPMPARTEREERPAPPPATGNAGQSLIPPNLRVVRLEPDPVEFSDETTPQVALSPPPRHHAPLPPAGPLPTETSLKEPLLADLAPQPVPEPAILDVQYQVALTAPNAIEQLEDFAKAHPEHASADNALFEAGLRAEKTGDAARAAKDFDQAVRQHPAGDTVADSLLHLAACDLTLNRPAAARHALEQLSTQYPDSAQAEAARVRLADLPH